MTADNPGRSYVFGGNQAMDQYMANRRATVEAAFLMPFLKPGLELADFGCGQGTITVGLAEAVAPGRVVGFDLQESHVERARQQAAERGLTNVTFQTGDVYDPPCEPASMDVVYMNAVLSHLTDPPRGLDAARRVLKPGGLLAMREPVGDGAVTVGNGSEVMERMRVILAGVLNASSGLYGTRTGQVMNGLCREAGFEVLDLSGSYEFMIPSRMPEHAQQPLAGPLGQRAIQMGLTTREELDEITHTFDTVSRTDPDAYGALGWFQVIARNP